MALKLGSFEVAKKCPAHSSSAESSPPRSARGYLRTGKTLQSSAAASKNGTLPNQPVNRNGKNIFRAGFILFPPSPFVGLGERNLILQVLFSFREVRNRTFIYSFSTNFFEYSYRSTGGVPMGQVRGGNAGAPLLEPPEAPVESSREGMEGPSPLLPLHPVVPSPLPFSSSSFKTKGARLPKHLWENELFIYI